MNELQKQIAADLLEIKAVFLRPEEPFTWASGIQSPIYCDNRVTYAEPVVRKHIALGYVQTIKAKYPQAEAIIGTSTSGIGYAALAAWLMELPTGYVRGGAKKSHGRNNQIEGRVTSGQKVVVVEDLISTAGSVIEVVEALREAGAEVLGIVSIFTYGMKKGLDRLAEVNVENTSLTNFDVLVEVAAEGDYITPKAIDALKAFRDNPGDEAWLGMLG